MTSKKEHYIRRRIEIAKKAIDIYSQGILTPLEVNCGCSAEELTKTWKETLKIEEDTLLQQLETIKPKP